MWNLKYMNIPVIIGTTGTVVGGLRKNSESVGGKHSTELLQKIWNITRNTKITEV
jgi:hypothetical protein